LQNQQIALGDYSPEKAGVGGSTPSLATMFSISCTPQKTALRGNCQTDRRRSAQTLAISAEMLNRAWRRVFSAAGIG
jgi:hypothetical protein